MSAQPRPLDDLITELVSGVIDIPSADGRRAGIQPVGVMFDLPVEARVASRDGRPVVLAEFARCRMTTVFDPPMGRLSLTLSTEGPP